VNRSHRTLLSIVGSLASAGALAACGGGGSSSTPHPRPTPTGGPPGSLSCTNAINVRSNARDASGLLRGASSGSRHTASVNPSTYTFDSNPHGLAVYVNQAAVGATTYSTVPQYANEPYQGVIRGPQANYGVCYAQLSNGPHTIYYNTAADTTGAIGTVAAASFGRSAPRRRLATRLVARMPLRRHDESGFDRSRIQVQFKVSAIHGDAAVAAALEKREGSPGAYTIGAVRNGTMNRIVTIPAGLTAQQFAQRMRSHDEVADARPLPLRYSQSVVPFFPNDVPPNGFYDPVDQWDLFGSGTAGLATAPNGIGAPYAWGYTHGSASVPIAIIDTGADLTASDLAGKISYEVAWVTGESPYPNTGATAAQDHDGHGTNVSGIAAADTNNAYGFAGTGFNSELQIYRIFPEPQAPCYTSCSSYGASTADEANAVYDALKHHARVINLSLGSCEGAGSPDPTEFAAIEAAISAGVVVAAAAGNERSGGGGSGCGTANTIDFPAAYPGVIAVGATSLNDGGSTNPDTATEYVASYSNSGPGLAVVAPGGDPSGTSDTDPLHWITNLYSSTVSDPSQQCQPIQGISPPLCAALFAGTSQATPHVSGVAALMLAANGSLGPAQIKAMMESTADNISDPNQGFGRLDAYRALAAVVGDTTGLPTPSVTNFVAIAYTVTSGSNKPNILNQTFTGGVPLGLDGSFRVADVLPTAPTFEIGLWYDANGDGTVDAGDYFGTAGPCSATKPCSAAATINVAPVTPGFVLH
jgi:subtilisin family serine protease